MTLVERALTEAPDGLPPLDLLVFVSIASYSGERVTLPQIAERAHVSERRCRLAVKTLLAAGCLIVVPGKGRSVSTYQMHLPSNQSIDLPLQSLPLLTDWTNLVKPTPSDLPSLITSNPRDSSNLIASNLIDHPSPDSAARNDYTFPASAVRLLPLDKASPTSPERSDYAFPVSSVRSGPSDEALLVRPCRSAPSLRTDTVLDDYPSHVDPCPVPSGHAASTRRVSSGHTDATMLPVSVPADLSAVPVPALTRSHRQAEAGHATAVQPTTPRGPGLSVPSDPPASVSPSRTDLSEPAKSLPNDESEPAAPIPSDGPGPSWPPLSDMSVPALSHPGDVPVPHLSLHAGTTPLVWPDLPDVSSRATPIPAAPTSLDPPRQDYPGDTSVRQSASPPPASPANCVRQSASPPLARTREEDLTNTNGHAGTTFPTGTSVPNAVAEKRRRLTEPQPSAAAALKVSAALSAYSTVMAEKQQEERQGDKLFLRQQALKLPQREENLWLWALRRAYSGCAKVPLAFVTKLIAEEDSVPPPAPRKAIASKVALSRSEPTEQPLPPSLRPPIGQGTGSGLARLQALRARSAS